MHIITLVLKMIYIWLKLILKCYYRTANGWDLRCYLVNKLNIVVNGNYISYYINLFLC